MFRVIGGPDGSTHVSVYPSSHALPAVRESPTVSDQEYMQPEEEETFQVPLGRGTTRPKMSRNLWRRMGKRVSSESFIHHQHPIPSLPRQVRGTVNGNIKLNLDQLPQIEFGTKRLYMYANSDTMDEEFLLQLLRRDFRGEMVLNPLEFLEHCLSDHQIRYGAGPTGVWDIEGVVNRSYSEFKPNITVLIPAKYSELVEINNTDDIYAFPTTLAQKCRSIYIKAFGNESMSYKHHYFVLVTPKPGSGKRREQEITSEITKVIQAEKMSLQQSNIIIMITSRVTYYSSIRRMMAGLACSACSIDLQSCYNRAYNMDAGGCSARYNTARPLL